VLLTLLFVAGNQRNPTSILSLISLNDLHYEFGLPGWAVAGLARLGAVFDAVSNASILTTDETASGAG
jgi:hypothetical protein